MSAPFFIEKENGLRLRFNEPRDKGCISLEMGTGGLCIFLDDQEMMDFAGTLIDAARRIRKARSSTHG